MEGVKKLTLGELENIFGNRNIDAPGYQNQLKAVIVFDKSNWDREYTETERSYEVYSSDWGWDWTKNGRCRTGNCLDGTDLGVRLDYYNWKVEYCYLLDN